VNSVSAQFTFLDLDIFVKVPELAIQASQVKHLTPLCATSAHSSGVHVSWPVAVCRRVCSLSDDPEAAQKLLHRRYVDANAHPDICRAILEWMPRGVNASAHDLNMKRAVFVLRYHPVFAAAFRTALRKVPPPPELELRLMAAWSNSLPSIASFINRGNHDMCRVMVREGGVFVSGQHQPHLLSRSLSSSNMYSTPLHNYTVEAIGK
jgi:hypothetical protein